MFDEKTVTSTLEDLIPARVVFFAQQVQLHGGDLYVVGGAVRDAAMGKESTDVDVEVHGLKEEIVHRLAQEVFGLDQVNTVGAAFGIRTVRLSTAKLGDIHVDIALPREDSKPLGANAHHVQVVTDPHIGLERALQRRDFTIGAMAYHLLDRKMHDPFGGLTHLASNQLRVVDSATFSDDPLRVLRAAQFAARFNLEVDDETAEILSQTTLELDRISAERNLEELRKLLTAPSPATGLRLLHRVDALKIVLPEVAACENVTQDPTHHPEGDVLEHTFQSVQAAGLVCDREGFDRQARFVTCLSALLHDVGKPLVWDENRNALGHDVAGMALTDAALQRLRCDSKTATAVGTLVGAHMRVHTMDENISNSALVRLETKLGSSPVENVTMVELLLALTAADAGGRNNIEQVFVRGDKDVWLRERYSQIGSVEQRKTPIISGDAFLKAGRKPGPHIGVLITLATEKVLDEKLSPEEAVQAALKEIPEPARKVKIPKHARTAPSRV